MHAAYDSESVLVSGAGAVTRIAPVGQELAQASQAVQRLKSMTGNPNDAREPKGFASVKTPVLKLFPRMLDMISTFSCNSAAGPHPRGLGLSGASRRSRGASTGTPLGHRAMSFSALC
jgi:hypothetical protein